MSSFSIKIGNFLYQNAFPIYNKLYPIFKQRNDKYDIQIIKQYVKKDAIILDIGANIGFYTKMLSELTGANGKVYSFEPDSTNFRHLHDNCSHLQNVQLFHKAVGNKDEVLTLYKSDLMNVDHKTFANEDFTSKETIDAVCLDNFIKEKHIDFVKIDIQGFEYYAFEGMQSLIKNSNDLKIITEFYPYGIAQCGIALDNWYQQLEDLDLFVYKNINGKLSIFDKKELSLYETKAKERLFYFDLFLTKQQL